MASLKQLASQTAIYGLSSIVGRLLNFLLTPLHTKVLPKEEYGQNVDIYVMIPFLLVFMVYAMETTFFKYYRDEKKDKNRIFSHTAGFVIIINIITFFLVWMFLEPLANLLRYPDHPEYLMWMFIITAIDAITAVPYAKLRAENKPVRFVIIRISTILTIVVLNLVFFLLFPWMQENNIMPALTELLYHPEIGVGYIFISNLVGSGLSLLLFMPDIFKIRWKPDWKLMRSMLLYSSPLVLSYLAGKINEMADRQFLKYLLPEEISFEQVAILGANLKIATFMVLFIQAFRFAAEPFFFSGDEDFKVRMAKVMRYFTAVQGLIYVAIICFLDVIKYFIDPKYWEGLVVVPIMTFANILLGIIFNLSIWYKLRHMTRMGAYITFVGLAFTIVGNIFLIPRYGYLGAAWASLISYIAMTIFSFYLNQKYDRTEFPVGRILMHLGAALFTGFISFNILHSELLPSTICFIVYATFVWFSEGKSVLKVIRR